MYQPENQSPPLGEGHALAAIRAKARNYRRAGTDVGEILQASQRLAHAQVLTACKHSPAPWSYNLIPPVPSPSSATPLEYWLMCGIAICRAPGKQQHAGFYRRCTGLSCTPLAHSLCPPSSFLRLGAASATKGATSSSQSSAASCPLSLW